MASLPFRTRGFQKDNLSCIIMSVCDLGQALVMHECFYRHTQGQHAARRTHRFAWNTARSFVESSLLLLTDSKLLLVDAYVCSCSQKRLQLSVKPRSSNTSRNPIFAESGTSCGRRHEMHSCPCAQTTKHNNYPCDASSAAYRRIVVASVYVCICVYVLWATEVEEGLTAQ